MSKDIIIRSFNNAEQNNSLKFWSDVFKGIKDSMGRGMVALHSLLILKKGTRASEFQLHKLIWSKVLMTNHSIKILYALGYNLQPLPLSSGGCVHHELIVKGSLDYCKKLAMSQFWLDVFGEIAGVGGGASCPRITFDN